MDSVCPMLYFNLDFKATMEKQHIKKAELFYKSSNDSAKMAVSQFELGRCMIRIFQGGGGRGGDTFKSLPPTNNFCLYPLPVLRCFWKDPLMTPHHPISSIFHCYPPPHPPPLNPKTILIIHKVGLVAFHKKRIVYVDFTLN